MNSTDKKVYFVGAIISGIIGAIAIFIYALTSWGILFGLIFGWIPAIIGGVIIGFLWPAIVGFIILIIVWSYFV